VNLVLDVSRYIHALMHDTGNINGVSSNPINDDVPACWKEASGARPKVQTGHGRFGDIAKWPKAPYRE